MKQKSSIMATLRPTHERGPYEKMLRKYRSAHVSFPLSLFASAFLLFVAGSPRLT